MVTQNHLTFQTYLTKPPSKLGVVSNYIIRTHAHYYFELYNLKHAYCVKTYALKGLTRFRLYNMNQSNTGFFSGPQRT